MKRLGRAVVLLWSEIPSEIQEHVREQALLIDTGNPGDEMTQLAQQIAAVLEKPWVTRKAS